jgi:Tol biopolymer transport system component
VLQIQCGAQSGSLWLDDVVFEPVPQPCPLLAADKLWGRDVLTPEAVWRTTGEDRWVAIEMPPQFALEASFETREEPVRLLFRRGAAVPVVAELGAEGSVLRAGSEVVAEGAAVRPAGAGEVMPISVTRYGDSLTVCARGRIVLTAPVPGRIVHVGTRGASPGAVWTFEGRLLLPPDHRAGLSEVVTYRDPSTGVTVHRMTRSPRHDKHAYYDVSPWSRDGRRLVFSSAEPGGRTSEIWVMNADGSGLRKVADNGTFSMHVGAFPQWGADNRTVYYSGRPEAGPARGLTVTVDTGETGVLGPSSRQISPDGRRSLYFHRRADRFADLGIMNTDGSGARIIASLDAVVALSPSQGAARANPPNLTNCKWSPDGSRILFGLVNTTRPGPKLKELFTVRPDGSELRYLCAYAHHHIWAPDSQRVLFNGDEAMMIINADGTGLRQISPLSSGHPSFSPDGRLIVTDVFGGRWGQCLVLINAGTGEVRKLVEVPSALGYSHSDGTHPHPCWSPDGKQILYDADWTGTCQLYVLDVPDWEDLPAGVPETAQEWQLQLNRGAQAHFLPETGLAAEGGRSMRVLIQRLSAANDKAYPTNVHLYRMVAVKPGHTYRFSAAFRARDPGRKVTLQLRTLGESSASFEVGPDWQVCTAEFDGPDQELTERLQILCGDARTPLWIDDIRFEEDGKPIFTDGFEK